MQLYSFYQNLQSTPTSKLEKQVSLSQNVIKFKNKYMDQ